MVETHLGRRLAVNDDLCTAFSEEEAKFRSVPGTPDADVFSLIEGGGQHSCAEWTLKLLPCPDARD